MLLISIYVSFYNCFIHQVFISEEFNWVSKAYLSNETTLWIKESFGTYMFVLFYVFYLFLVKFEKFHLAPRRKALNGSTFCFFSVQ